MTRIKICGITNKTDLELCVQERVQMLGFVVDYPEPVPWNLSVSEAVKLIRHASAFAETCVVTGGSAEKVLQVAEETCPAAIQLHHKETLEEVGQIVVRLKKKGIKTIKALRIDRHGKCASEISEPVHAARALVQTGIDALLLDSYIASRPGGTGIAVDLSVFRAVQKVSTVPVILAGGLTPANILSIISECRPYAVDTLSGLERSPGQKDAAKIAAFVRAVRGIDRELPGRI